MMTSASGRAAMIASRRLADAREDRRQAREHRQNAHDRDVADRKQALEPSASIASPPTPRRRRRPPRLAKRAHELEAELVARMLAGDERDAERLGAPLTPETRRRTGPRRRPRARSVSRSTTSTRPAASATPRNCALPAPAIVCGPIAGMSSRRSCPRFGAFTSTPAGPLCLIRPLARISATRASIASVPSAASIARTRPAATIAPCPASKVGQRVEQPCAERDVGLRPPARRRRAPSSPRGASEPRRDLVRADDADAFALEDRRRARRAARCRRARKAARARPARLTAPQSSRRSANSGRVIAPIIAISPMARSFSAANSLPTSPMRTQTCG